MFIQSMETSIDSSGAEMIEKKWEAKKENVCIDGQWVKDLLIRATQLFQKTHCTNCQIIRTALCFD